MYGAPAKPEHLIREWPSVQALAETPKEKILRTKITRMEWEIDHNAVWMLAFQAREAKKMVMGTRVISRYAASSAFPNVPALDGRKIKLQKVAASRMDCVYGGRYYNKKLKKSGLIYGHIAEINIWWNNHMIVGIEFRDLNRGIVGG